MAVRSTTFYVGTIGLPNGDVTSLFTVPTGRTAIVKEFRMMNRSGLTVDSVMGVRRGGSSTWLDVNPSLPSSGILGGSGRYYVLLPGDELVVYAYSAGATTVNAALYAAGTLLLGVSDG